MIDAKIEFVKALPVLLGALLAIVGGVITQLLAHHFSAKRENEKLLREKAELLVQYILEYGTWINEKRDAVLFHSGLHDKPSPLDKALAIQTLYFPKLESNLRSVAGAGNPMLEFISNELAAKSKDKMQWSGTFSLKPYMDSYLIYLDVQAATIKQIAEHRALSSTQGRVKVYV